MFTKEDFEVESFSDFASFMLVAPFVGLVAPFLIAAYSLGFVLELTGWLDS
jgi:hypothetical protein